MLAIVESAVSCLPCASVPPSTPRSLRDGQLVSFSMANEPLRDGLLISVADDEFSRAHYPPALVVKRRRINRGTFRPGPFGNRVVTCGACGKRTHSDIGGYGLDLCAACLDASFTENAHSDGLHDGAPCATCPACNEQKRSTTMSTTHSPVEPIKPSTKHAKRIATMKENPTPENVEAVLLGGPVTPKKKAAPGKVTAAQLDAAVKRNVAAAKKAAPKKAAAEARRAADKAVTEAKEAIARVQSAKDEEHAKAVAEEKIAVAAKKIGAAVAASKEPVLRADGVLESSGHVGAVTHPHPKPHAGQVWSTPTPTGRSYLRIEAVRHKANADESFAEFVRVTDATGLKIAQKSPSSPFAGRKVDHKLVKGEMDPKIYRYEGEAAAHREHYREAGEKKEDAVSAVHKAVEKKAIPKPAPKREKKAEHWYVNQEGRRKASNEEVEKWVGHLKAKDPKVTWRAAFLDFVTDNRFACHNRFKRIFRETKATKA